MIPVWRKTPLEKGKATPPSIPTWRVPWTVEPGGLSPWGHEELDTTEQPSTQHWRIKRPEAGEQRGGKNVLGRGQDAEGLGEGAAGGAG